MRIRGSILQSKVKIDRGFKTQASSPTKSLDAALRGLEKSQAAPVNHQGRNLLLKRVRSPQFERPATSFLVEFGAMGSLFCEDDPVTQSIAGGGTEIWGQEFAEAKGQKRIQRDLARRAEQLCDRKALLDLFFNHVSNEHLRVLRTDSFGLWHALRIAQEEPRLLVGFNRIMVTSPFIALHAGDRLDFKSFYKGHEVIFGEIQNDIPALANIPCIFSWLIPQLDVVCDFSATKKAYGKMPVNRRSALVFHRANHRLQLTDDNPDASIFLEILPSLLRGKLPPPNAEAFTCLQGEAIIP